MANQEQPNKPYQPEQAIDLSQLPDQEHKFQRIVGNRLECVMSGHVDGIFIKPTQVLERDKKGVLQLVDKG